MLAVPVLVANASGSLACRHARRTDRGRTPAGRGCGMRRAGQSSAWNLLNHPRLALALLLQDAGREGEHGGENLGLGPRIVAPESSLRFFDAQGTVVLLDHKIRRVGRPW